MKKAKILIGIISVIAGVAALLLVAGVCFGWKYHQANRLITAINNEDVAAVEELFENGVDPNQTDVPPSLCWSFFEFSARRPLAEACSTGNLEIVSLLVEHGATAECIEHTGWSPLRETLFYYQPDDVQIVEMLLGDGDINATNAHGETLLMISAKKRTPALPGG